MDNTNKKRKFDSSSPELKRMLRNRADHSELPEAEPKEPPTKLAAVTEFAEEILAEIGENRLKIQGKQDDD